MTLENASGQITCEGRGELIEILDGRVKYAMAAGVGNCHVTPRSRVRLGSIQF